MDLENKIEAQRKRMEQEKNKLDMLMKKAKMEQRRSWYFSQMEKNWKDCMRDKLMMICMSWRSI